MRFATKYIIDEADPINDHTRNFKVRAKNEPEWVAREVWYDGEHAWCSSCSGPLAAMSRSCKHAAAVKRYIKIHSY